MWLGAHLLDYLLLIDFIWPYSVQHICDTKQEAHVVRYTHT